MSAAQLEQALKDLPRHGKLIKDRGYRQVWRLEAGGRAFYLKFYPRSGWRPSRLLRGSPAMREFLRLQWLQRAEIPGTRAVGVLIGYQLDGRAGDAVITEAIEPSVTLDQHVNEYALKAQPVPEHRLLVRQMMEIVEQLNRAGYGHADLHLGNFLLSKGKLLLVDAYEVHRGGVSDADLLHLGHSVREHATRADLLRGWKHLRQDAPIPWHNPVSLRQWRRLVGRATGANRYFGQIRDGAWSGYFFRCFPQPRRWAPVSRLSIDLEQWRQVWQRLGGQIESGQLEPADAAADAALDGQIVLDGRPIDVRVWRGRVRPLLRRWRQAWRLIVRNIPTLWPIAVMWRGSFLGLGGEAVLVCQRMSGWPLAELRLDRLSDTQRNTLFARLGHQTRQIDSTGLVVRAMRAADWLVRQDEVLGPVPMLEGIQRLRTCRRGSGLSIRALLSDLRRLPQYVPADSLALCRGYAPFARLSVEVDTGVPAPERADRNCAAGEEQS